MLYTEPLIVGYVYIPTYPEPLSVRFLMLFHTVYPEPLSVRFVMLFHTALTPEPMTLCFTNNEQFLILSLRFPCICVLISSFYLLYPVLNPCYF